VRVIRSVQHGNIKTPEKKTQGRKKTYNVDDFDAGVIRRTIHSLYSAGKWPTLDDIGNALTVALPHVFPVAANRGTIHTLVRHLGFQFKKFDCRQYLLKRSDLRALRSRFLRRITEARTSGKNIVYLDETWFSENQHVSKIWESDCKTFRDIILHERLPKSGKGRRLIILHAGGNLGWVPGAALCFICDGSKVDYHENMTGDRFWKWFEQQLIPNLPPKTSIVMDNAPYHCVYQDGVPKSTSKKQEFQDWLRSIHVDFPRNAKRDELWKFFVKPHKNLQQAYKIDHLAALHGHEVSVTIEC
jgi:hypothetical protein